MQFLSSIGLQSPNIILAVVTLMGLLITGGFGIMLVGEGVRLRDQNSEMSQQAFMDSRKYLVAAIMFAVLGSVTVLLLLLAFIVIEKIRERKPAR